jgi:hypothetical protein
MTTFGFGHIDEVDQAIARVRTRSKLMILAFRDSDYEAVDLAGRELADEIEELVDLWAEAMKSRQRRQPAAA